MARFPANPSTRIEDYPDAPAWFARYLEATKPWSTSVSQALAGGLSYENTLSTVITTTLTTGATPEATFETDKVAVRHALGRRPTSVTIAAIHPVEPGARYTTESWREVAAGDFLNGWHNWDNHSDHNTAAYYQDPWGRVHLKGFVEGGTVAVDETGYIFRMAAGFAPAKEEIHIVASDATFGLCYVHPDGHVAAYSGNNASFSLDGVSFRAATGAPGVAAGLPQWEPLDTHTVRIRYIAGLAPNTKYHVTFVVQ